MRAAFLFAALLSLAGASGADAQQGPGFGNWFGYGERGETIVMTVKGRVGLMIGCSKGTLTLAIVDRGRQSAKLMQGEALIVTFRADRKPAIATTATARNAESLDIGNPSALVREIKEARRVDFRIARADGRVFTRDYDVKGAPEAVAEIAKGCPI